MNAWTAQYLAGVLDSDGSFTVTKRHIYRVNCNYTCMIQLTWTLTKKSREFMEQLVNFYGGSYFVGMPSSTKQFENAKEIIKYCATGNAAERIARDTRNYLLLKEEQARNIIKVRDLVRSYRGQPRPKSAVDQLEELYLTNQRLNGKNKDVRTSV